MFIIYISELLKAARNKLKADEAKAESVIHPQETLPTPEPLTQWSRNPRRKQRQNRRKNRQNLPKFQWRRAFRLFWKWLKKAQKGQRRRRNRQQNRRRNRQKRPNHNHYDEDRARLLFAQTFGSLNHSK